MSRNTQKRSMVASFFVMVAAMAGGLLKTSSGKAIQSGRKSTHASGMGRNSGAIHSPKRTKFKPSYMRDPQYRAKRKTK
jgi:hypothetical protein